MRLVGAVRVWQTRRVGSSCHLQIVIPGASSSVNTHSSDFSGIHISGRTARCVSSDDAAPIHTNMLPTKSTLFNINTDGNPVVNGVLQREWVSRLSSPSRPARGGDRAEGGGGHSPSVTRDPSMFE
jgi:hypothetical protein